MEQKIDVKEIDWYRTEVQPENESGCSIWGEVSGFPLFFIKDVMPDDGSRERYQLKSELPFTIDRLYTFEKKDEAKEFAKKLLHSFVNKFVQVKEKAA